MGMITPWNLIIMFIGIDLTTSLIATIVSALTPFIASVMGAIFLKEEVTKNERIGILLAFLGILGVVLLRNDYSGISIVNDSVGVLLIILANFVYVGGFILYKKAPQKDRNMISYSSPLMAVLFFLITFVILKPSWIIPPQMTYETTFSVLYMAIFGSLIAFFAYQHAVNRIEVSEASISTYIQPLFGIPAAVLIANETLNPIIIIPILIIVIGIWFNIKEKFNFKIKR